MQRTEFQKNGNFDPESYRRLLAANRLTPASFEAMEAKDILTNKGPPGHHGCRRVNAF